MDSLRNSMMTQTEAREVGRANKRALVKEGTGIHEDRHLDIFGRVLRAIEKIQTKEEMSNDTEHPSEDTEEKIVPMYHIPDSVMLCAVSAMNYKRWRKFVTSELQVPEETLQKMKVEVGVVSNRLKIETMRHWLNEHGGSNGRPFLIQKAQNFISLNGEVEHRVNQKTGKMLRAIADAIPNDRWMRFARVNLGLSRSEMDMLKSRYARFTDEQRYQIMKHWLQHGQMPVEDGEADNKQTYNF